MTEGDKERIRCFFCFEKKEIHALVGKKNICETCVIELCDNIYHNFDGKFGKHICEKLDRMLGKGEKLR